MTYSPPFSEAHALEVLTAQPPNKKVNTVSTCGWRGAASHRFRRLPSRWVVSPYPFEGPPVVFFSKDDTRGWFAPCALPRVSRPGHKAPRHLREALCEPSLSRPSSLRGAFSRALSTPSSSRGALRPTTQPAVIVAGRIPPGCSARRPRREAPCARSPSTPSSSRGAFRPVTLPAVLVARRFAPGHSAGCARRGAPCAHSPSTPSSSRVAMRPVAQRVVASRNPRRSSHAGHMAYRRGT